MIFLVVCTPLHSHALHHLALDVLTGLMVQMAVVLGVSTIGSMACGAMAALCCGRVVGRMMVSQVCTCRSAATSTAHVLHLESEITSAALMRGCMP